MARYQYRISSSFAWAGSPGNAVFALLNKSTSGKRITIRSLEAFNRFAVDALSVATANQCRQILALRTGTFDSGGATPLVPSPLDSTATMPSGISILTGGTYFLTGRPHYRVFTDPSFDNTASTINAPKGGEDVLQHLIPRSRRAVAEPVVVRPGETMGLTIERAQRTFLMKVTATFTVGGHTWTVAFDTAITGDGAAVLVFENDSASDIIRIRDIAYRIKGASTVTPYLQVVPFAAVDPTAIESNQYTNILKMDSAYPDPSSWLQVIYDTPLTPQGAPIQYASDVGAGAPKGFNYLSTKDLLGPVLRTLFPEYRTFISSPQITPLAIGDTIGKHFSHRDIDLLARGAGITLRPGEGIAITAAAETVGSSAVAIGGGTPFDFGCNFDVESLVQPYLTLTGLQAGSDIVILEAGTGNILQQIDAYSGTSWTWPYDSDIVTSVDVCVYKPGFVPLALRNVTTPAEGLSIPIVQTPDRNYV